MKRDGVDVGELMVLDEVEERTEGGGVQIFVNTGPDDVVDGFSR